MWPPRDNLDDFRGRTDRPAEPPSSVLLESSGETEILKPLAVWEGYVKRTAVATESTPSGLSWFHRSLALSGAVATIALIVGTGIYLGLYGPPLVSVANSIGTEVSPPDVALSEQTADDQTSQEDSDDNDSLLDSNSTSAFLSPNAAPSVAKRRIYHTRVNRAATRPRVLFAANRFRRHLLPRPQFIVSDFVPTNLIIFVENGHIKTRIEPQLTAVYKRSPAGSQ